jgi:exodeoxyribonuclease VII large subunit
MRVCISSLFFFMISSSHPSVPLTVSQLTHAIKSNLEASFPLIHLQGEVSNCKLQTSGHLYFSLKDTHAQISAVMFKGEAMFLKILPKGGEHVIIKGELNVYPPKGNYQLIVRELTYMGVGELLQKLEFLKIKLHQLGWFKAARKKPLPPFPQRIGVVTSPTGAVIQDILNILTRRFSSFHLILNPVKVQGEGAAQEIAQAIEQFNQHRLVDVMIVGRGGGSLEDLWAFNEEIVATAIYESQIPVISAVGHETDHCIADYVADVRAPTPSAAAEIVIAEKQQLLDYLASLQKRMQQTLRHLIQQNHYRLKGILKNPLIAHPQAIFEWRMQKLDDCRLDLATHLHQTLRWRQQKLEAMKKQIESLKPIAQISHLKQRLMMSERALEQQISRDIHRYRQRLIHLSHLLQALNPKNLLNKGYSILFAEKGKSVINSVRKLEKGQQAKLLLSDGEALITIIETSLHEHTG